MNFGKAEAAQKGHRKKTGFAPRNSFNPGIEPAGTWIEPFLGTELL